MPVHDWSRVSAGTFHDFHLGWICEFRKVLNTRLLPEGYYGQIEGMAKDAIPDDLVGLAAEEDVYTQRRRTLVIRHASNDQVVALIEILSPGNKSSRRAVADLLDKLLAALVHGYHLLLIDLQPCTARDPNGIHGLVWAELNSSPYAAPMDKPLTLVSYTADRPRKAYVEPIAVGDVLPDMPLFLSSQRYVSVPLESSYTSAYEGVPRRWQ